MTTPTWLLDAIQTIESVHVSTVPKSKDDHWVQRNNAGSFMDGGSSAFVPNVPNVPTRTCLLQEEAHTDAQSSSNISDKDHKHHEESQREFRFSKVIAMLESAPGTRYAMHVGDASTDPVIVTVCIRGTATCELEIPYEKYDGMALLELIEKHTRDEHAKA